LLRIADRDVLDVLVLAEADHRLDVHAAFDPDHFRRVVEPFDQPGVFGMGYGQRGGGKQRGEEHGADHLNFSMGRAGARKRLPRPRVRDGEDEAGEPTAPAALETKRVSRITEPGAPAPESFAAAGVAVARRISRALAVVAGAARLAVPA